VIKYEQSTGAIYLDDKLLCKYPDSYSGFGNGRNNPAYEKVPDCGPIPKGVWYIARWYPQYEGKGALVARLVPKFITETYGRAGFLIHGDSIERPGQGSHGCIIAPLAVRRILATSLGSDNWLAVI